MYTGVGIFGAFSAIQGRITVGQLSSFLNYANQYTKPFNEISGVVTELQNALACAGRIFQFLDEEPVPENAPDAKTLDHVEGRVGFEDVSFSYTSEVPLIEHMNLEVKPGQRVAIVGPTGCGKTTVINLLMRFYDVNKGKITLDGVPIQDLTWEVSVPVTDGASGDLVKSGYHPGKYLLRQTECHKGRSNRSSQTGTRPQFYQAPSEWIWTR